MFHLMVRWTLQLRYVRRRRYTYIINTHITNRQTNNNNTHENGTGTMVIHDGKVFLQAGGGIVYDSKPRDEYVETVNKLAATVSAVLGGRKDSSMDAASSKKRRLETSSSCENG